MHDVTRLLFDLPVLLSALIFIALVVALSLGTFALARHFFARHATDDTRDLAGSVLFRIAALHGLVLALVFAQELGSIRDVNLAASHEAAMLGDIYYDTYRYDPDATQEIRASLARYAVIVADEEWQRLADSRQLLLSAWKEWEAAYDALLDLAPQSPRQERLLDIMLKDIRDLSELREARENAALAGTSTLFFIAALSGIVLISAAYFTWAPTAINLSLITGFSAYTGLIIYFVMAYSNPYLAPGNADPLSFKRFLSEDVRAVAAGDTGG